MQISGIGNETASLDARSTLRDREIRSLTVQVTVRDANGDRAVPLAGTLVVSGSLAQGLPAEQIVASTALTSAANWIFQLPGTGYASLEFTVASLTAAHTVDVFILER